MAADTFTIPEQVTVPTEALAAALGLIDVYETVCAEIAGVHRDSWDSVLDDYWMPLFDALRQGRHDDEATDEAWNPIYAAKDAAEPVIRERLGRPDALRIAELEEAVLQLGSTMMGARWDREGRKWMTRAEYLSAAGADDAR